MKKIIALTAISLLTFSALYIRQISAHAQQVVASIPTLAAQHEVAAPVDYREFESPPSGGAFTQQAVSEPFADTDPLVSTNPNTSATRIIVVKH